MKIRLFKCFIFVAIFISFSMSAISMTFNNFKWTLSPIRPIQNSTFEFTVLFNYSGKSKPKINFELDGCELVKKKQ